MGPERLLTWLSLPAITLNRELARVVTKKRHTPLAFEALQDETTDAQTKSFTHQPTGVQFTLIPFLSRQDCLWSATQPVLPDFYRVQPRFGSRLKGITWCVARISSSFMYCRIMSTVKRVNESSSKLRRRDATLSAETQRENGT